MEFFPFAEYIYQLKQTIETAIVKITKYEALDKEKDDGCVHKTSPKENPVQPTELAGEVKQLKQELEKSKRPLPPEVCPPHTCFMKCSSQGCLCSSLPSKGASWYP